MGAKNVANMVCEVIQLNPVKDYKSYLQKSCQKQLQKKLHTCHKKNYSQKTLGVNVLAEFGECISTVQIKDCPRNCKVGPWGTWSPCTKEEDSKKTRERYIIYTASNGGIPCCNELLLESNSTISCVPIREAKHFLECGKQQSI